MNGVKWSKIEQKKPDNVIIVCTGPSLTNFNFESLKGKGYIIAVNDAGKFVPFADAWFTLDPWGLTGQQLPPVPFTGQLYAAVPEDYALSDARANNHRVAANQKIKYLHRVPFHS